MSANSLFLSNKIWETKLSFEGPKYLVDETRPEDFPCVSSSPVVRVEGSRTSGYTYSSVPVFICSLSRTNPRLYRCSDYGIRSQGNTRPHNRLTLLQFCHDFLPELPRRTHNRLCPSSVFVSSSPPSYTRIRSLGVPDRTDTVHMGCLFDFCTPERNFRSF